MNKAVLDNLVMAQRTIHRIFGPLMSVMIQTGLTGAQAACDIGVRSANPDLVWMLSPADIRNFRLTNVEVENSTTHAFLLFAYEAIRGEWCRAEEILGHIWDVSALLRDSDLRYIPARWSY